MLRHRLRNRIAYLRPGYRRAHLEIDDFMRQKAEEELGVMEESILLAPPPPPLRKRYTVNKPHTNINAGQIGGLTVVLTLIIPLLVALDNLLPAICLFVVSKLSMGYHPTFDPGFIQVWLWTAIVRTPYKFLQSLLEALCKTK